MEIEIDVPDVVHAKGRGRRPAGRHAERAARSACFRDLNDEMWAGALSDLEVGWFVCECGSESCTDSVKLSMGKYSALRKQPGSLLVVPGHGPAVASIERRARQARRSLAERFLAQRLSAEKHVSWTSTR